MANRKNSTMRVGLYDVGKVIGVGNFATVRLARHMNTKSEVSTSSFLGPVSSVSVDTSA